jgi:RNA polymerase sigma-70 factor (ECF subfamily)
VNRPAVQLAAGIDSDRHERLRARDRDAIRETLEELLPHVRRWLFRLLGHSPDLDDATQEVLAELAGFLPRFEGRSKLETAAHTIATRVAYRYFAKQKTVTLEAVPEPVAPHVDADTRLVAREALARLQRCLRRLPPKRRAAFVLCAIEGMTPAEAARMAGTTALAMRCRLLWARREVSRMLAHDPYLAHWLPNVDAEVES